MRSFTLNTLNVFNIQRKIFINMIIICDLYLSQLELQIHGTISFFFFFFFLVQQFTAGHLTIAYEIPTRHKRKLEHATNTQVYGVGFE